MFLQFLEAWTSSSFLSGHFGTSCLHSKVFVFGWGSACFGIEIWEALGGNIRGTCRENNMHGAKVMVVVCCAHDSQRLII